MSREQNKTALATLPGAKLVTNIAKRVTKDNKRLAQQERNKNKLHKAEVRHSKKRATAAAVASQATNKFLLSALPSIPLSPVTASRNRIVKQRAKTAKRSKKTPKRVAARKAKAVLIQQTRNLRLYRKSIAKYEAADAAYKARCARDDAERAAFIAAKEAEPPMKVTFVEDIDGVKALVDEVMSLSHPALYLDAEGISLGRSGDLVLLQMYIDTDAGPHTYVVDVWALKTDGAFHTRGTEYPQTTLKSLLEDPSIPKLFWDCRMDSEALYHQHQIALAGVLDIQLMEVARRDPYYCPYDYICSYGRCVENDAGLDWYDKAKMSTAKGAKSLFIPRLGGSWDVLTARPLDPRLVEYCAGDVRYMPRLVERYSAGLVEKDRDAEEEEEGGCCKLERPAEYFADHGYEWTRKVVEESKKRVERSQGNGWDRRVDCMVESPWVGHSGGCEDGWDYYITNEK